MSVHSFAERETDENPSNLSNPTFYFQLDKSELEDLEDDDQGEDVAGSVGVVRDAVQQIIKTALQIVCNNSEQYSVYTQVQVTAKLEKCIPAWL